MGKLQHNLNSDDLLHAVDVINTTNDISLSEEKHKSNDVLMFKKNIGGDLTFLTEVHVKRAIFWYLTHGGKKWRGETPMLPKGPRGLRPKRVSVCR
jgi:hypothetical protein